jgi:outer membrane protein OmpA-like peptidoglycan-associated protein
MGNPNAQVDLQLYVGGYTDTVGSARDNQRLSNARARAIAQKFRKLGVALKIYYAGFGERGLLFKTADSTPEPRNRRALYVISNVIPSGPFFPSQSWRELR